MPECSTLYLTDHITKFTQWRYLKTVASKSLILNLSPLISRSFGNCRHGKTVGPTVLIDSNDFSLTLAQLPSGSIYFNSTPLRNINTGIQTQKHATLTQVLLQQKASLSMMQLVTTL